MDLAGMTGNAALQETDKESLGKQKRQCRKDIVPQVIHFISTIETEELRSLKIFELSRRFNINASFLSRTFKARRKCTLCEFIQREKIRRAVVLLQREESWPIKKLAVYLGFSSTEYFIRTFKKRIGVPPHRYRQYISNY